MWDYVLISFRQVMLRAQKRLIDGKENNLILALHFHLSQGCMHCVLTGQQFDLLKCRSILAVHLGVITV